MHTILVQGSSCISLGSIEILKQFISYCPRNQKIIFICPYILKNDSYLNKYKSYYNLKFFFIPHSIFGIVLGPFVDIISTTIFTKFKLIDHYINFSNYGLCFSSKFSLFFHNSHLINENNTLKKRSKFKLIFKKIILIDNLKRAKNVYIQTNHMLKELSWIYKNKKIDKSNLKLLPISLPKKIIYRSKSNFEFQLFYPCLDLPHKRCELAIKSTINASELNNKIGLVITIPKKYKYLKNKQIYFCGTISKKNVHFFYNSSKALLITSDKESLGLPILEALTFSIPVIAPRLPYVEEILGDAACYFNSFDENDIKNAIIDCHERYDQWLSKIVKRKKLYETLPNTMKLCWDNLISNL